MKMRLLCLRNCKPLRLHVHQLDEITEGSTVIDIVGAVGVTGISITGFCTVTDDANADEVGGNATIAAICGAVVKVDNDPFYFSHSQDSFHLRLY